MSDIIISKFGGSSVADAKQIAKVRDIVKSDKKRRVIVVSGPGRSHKSEEKVTDHLINIATKGIHFYNQRQNITADDSRKAVVDKFTAIMRDLKVDDKEIIEALKKDLNTELGGDKRVAFLASRGEHYNARIIAAYFNNSDMPAKAQLPEDVGFLVSDNYLAAKTLDKAYENVLALQEFDGISVVPGFYGVTEDGHIAVFSRGGSDLTGGEIAYALDADTYENWTDVNGVYEADPRIIKEARAIPRLTFKEIRLLSSKGFNVFHLDAMLKCRDRKIPINIRNTNAPNEPGTLILNERVPEEGVVGIARLDNMSYIHIEKDMLGEEVGFTASLLQIFHDFGINTYHYPTDKDDIAVLVSKDDLLGSINDLRRVIEKRLKPDNMRVEYNLSIITPVGLGLNRNSYPIIEALSALGDAHVPIELIDQSPSQICFHVGVYQTVADEATRILYNTLIGSAR
ncbi:aspartate kinase [Gilvimarinus algae]|uniref:Aspartokinase n=1 Tax=Gilvimarinus algae TaxID=3058037 RepID=A0ABT8TH02_9GAMM|nr:aspartate kinase [Gilvimarinus sp. SDUM040014]MDO3383374.1 aspartate kinase [Gilvimarinus sp. SDUM040014]